MKSLLYVSLRRVTRDTNVHDVDDIMARSRARNAKLDLTGALVATPNLFAQLLEGPAVSIDEMMQSITRDPRHFGMVFAPIVQKPEREFHRWALAYHGESSYVSELIAAVIEGSEEDLPRHGQNIRSLMAMFA